MTMTPGEKLERKLKKEHPIRWWWEGFKIDFQLFIFDISKCFKHRRK